MGHMIPTLRSYDVKMLFKHSVFLLLVFSLLLPGFLWAQSDESLMTQEYFVEQRAKEGLLLRISAFESEFESKVSGRGGNLILHSAMPGSRIIPLFQYIAPQADNRQIDIEVSSGLYSARSEFSLGLTRVAAWDDRSSSIDQAYQLLSFGMQADEGESAANWTVKIDSLSNASRLFKRFGMKEMRLWSDYMAAHLIYSHLHDHSIVYSMCREILAEVRGTHFKKIELASLRLQTNALIGLKRSGTLEIPTDKPDPVQLALLNTAKLANSMGFYYEQAQILNLSGSEYVAGSAYVPALSQYQRAVEIADVIGDVELATGIRESIVEIHAIQGNVTASSAVLQKIESQLVEEGGGDDLALNLLAQGRLFIRSYHFLKAYEILSQALVQQNNSAIRRQVNFELARVFYETGRLERAKTYLQLADVSIRSGSKNRGSGVIDVGEGLRILANIYRSESEFDLMRKARIAQGQHQPPLALYRYEQGLDALASASNSESKARSLFAQSQTAASTSGHADLRQLALLQMCALASIGQNTGSCASAKTRASFRKLESGGVPRNSVEAMHLWAKILVKAGRRSDAIEVLARMTSDVQFYRHLLPGVLGSWYRQRSEAIFEYYLAQVLRDSPQRSASDGAAPLLALTKIRFADKYSESDSAPLNPSTDTDLLRIQLGERAESKSSQVITSLNKSINTSLAGLKPEFDQEFGFLSAQGLQKYLRSLNNNEILLTYHLSQKSAHAWVGSRSGVQQVSVSDPARLYADLQYSREGLSSSGISTFENNMSALGARLLKPVAGLLKETIYFVPAGNLLGLPFDALRLNGRYLIEDHRLVNLTAFPLNTTPSKSLKTEPAEKIFVAGHPQDYSSSYLSHLNTSSEINAVADIFVGPGLTIIQGAALLPDEFQTEQYRSADLIHLSMPASINLKYPEQSSLELSGDEDSSEHSTVSSVNILRQALQADLVFLSGSGMNNVTVSPFSNQPALITDFQKVGATAVVSGLWATEGRATEGLITGFYRSLESTANLAVSLQSAKLQYLKANRDDGLYDWASLQLYIE